MLRFFLFRINFWNSSWCYISVGENSPTIISKSGYIKIKIENIYNLLIFWGKNKFIIILLALMLWAKFPFVCSLAQGQARICTQNTQSSLIKAKDTGRFNIYICLHYISVFEICVSISHKPPIIMGDRQKNFKDWMRLRSSVSKYNVGMFLLKRPVCIGLFALYLMHCILCIIFFSLYTIHALYVLFVIQFKIFIFPWYVFYILNCIPWSEFHIRIVFRAFSSMHRILWNLVYMSSIKTTKSLNSNHN